MNGNRCFIYLALMLSFSGRLIAGEGSQESREVGFFYKAFSEAEINEAVKRPLTLNDCISIALAKNIPLKLVQGDLNKAEAAHAGAYSIFFPVFTIEGVKENRDEKRLPVFPNPDTTSISPIRNQALVGRVIQLFPTGAVLDFATDLRRDVNAPDRFQSPDRTKNRIFNLRLTQPLLRGAWPTVVRNAISASDYDRQIQNTLLLDQKLKTVFLVKSAFYEVLLQHELLKVNQAAIERDSTLLFASESKVEAKLATRRDVLSAEIQLASDKATLIKNQTDYQFALDGLKEILGLPIELEIDIADTELDFSIQALDEQALIERAAMMNPTLQSTTLAVNRSKLQLTVARNARLPQLDLVASYSRNFESKLASDPEENTDLHTTAWEFSFNFSYPFLNRDAVTKTEIAQVDLSQQQERLQELRRQIQVSIRSIVRSTYSAIEEIKILQRSIEAAEQKVAFATTMFNLGRASNLDITDAQEALLKAETQYVQKLVDYHIQLALLESLTGQVITN
jgi:outer membrane protein TolC